MEERELAMDKKTVGGNGEEDPLKQEMQNPTVMHSQPVHKR